jgi:hypothetical protein
MKTLLKVVMPMAFALCVTIASSAQQSQSSPDNMTPYRVLAADTLAAVNAHDLSTAKKKARELEVAWDKGEKALEKKSPDLWGQIDKAMDDFIKPIMKQKSPDPAKVKTAYDGFIAKLQGAVTK